MYLVKALIIVASITATLAEPPSYLPPYQPPSTNYGTPYQGPEYAPPPPVGQTGSYGGHGGSYEGQGSYEGHGHGHGHDNEVPKAYEFGYSVKDAQSGNDYDRHEKSDGDTVTGEYRVQLPDGRTQIVTYHADWRTGFHADVRYEGEAHYPDQHQNTGNGGYNYNAPEFSGSLTGFNNGFGYKPAPSYGTPGY